MILLRSAAFGVWFYAVTVAFCLAGPWPIWRARRRGPAAIQAYAAVWAGVILAGLRVLCGVAWRLDGAENLPPPGHPALLAAQHQSTFETLFWLARRPDVIFVVKRELFAIPLFGALLRGAGMIEVDRSGGAAALRGLLRDATAAAAARRPIVIFPEGTRSPAGQVGRLRPGVAFLAERTGLPVIPILTDSGRSWGRLAFRKNPGTIHVAVCPALPAGLSRAALIQRLYDIFATGNPVENSVGGVSGVFPRSPKQSS
jgi:1-acyl-sn-glycerol-3-phosphate acyltransferase